MTKTVMFKDKSEVFFLSSPVQPYDHKSGKKG